MLRHALTFVMLAGYLAGQLATVRHIHAAEHSDHARSHVHGDWFTRLFTTKHRSHAHEELGTHHSHSEHEHPASSPPADNEHDGNCVYWPDLGLAAPSKTMEQSAKVCSITVIIETATGVSCSMLLSDIQSKAPPDGLLLGCARFLKLRTLRI